jgi:tetratricopeptide (TPR) repeat protein
MRRDKLISVLVAMTVWAACAQQPIERCRPCAEEQGRPLEPPLMALISAARSYHHLADLYLEQANSEQAEKALTDLLAMDLDSRWPEAEDIRLDAVTRLAKLVSDRGEGGRALQLVDEGLARARRTSFYLANLHGVRGDVLQASAKRLSQAGKTEEARLVARRAIEAFSRSIELNKLLMSKLPRRALRPARAVDASLKGTNDDR